MNISNLADGVYSITGNMVKVDKTTAFMSDAAIDHTIKLTVKNGKYYITLNFNEMCIRDRKLYGNYLHLPLQWQLSLQRFISFWCRAMHRSAVFPVLELFLRILYLYRFQ